MKKRNKKIKILFGAVDIGWRIKLYSTFLTAVLNGKIETTSFVKYKVSKKQYVTQYDFEGSFDKHGSIYRWLYSFVFFIYALFKFNTFYFLSGESLLTRKLRRFEFLCYKLFHKKLIMHFVGSDIRDPNYIFWKVDHIIQHLNEELEIRKTAKWQDKLISDSKKFASHILVSTPDLLDIIPSAKYYPVVIDLNGFYKELQKCKSNNGFFKTEKIKVLHAPSNTKIKGSGLINQILKEIEIETGLIEFIYSPDLKKDTGTVYTVSRYDLFQLYTEADIVIDQLIIGWYGLQAIEALLAKCHVFCYIDQKLTHYLANDCPIQVTNALTLKSDLTNFLKNYSPLNMESTLAWVKKNHTIEENHQPLMEAIV